MKKLIVAILASCLCIGLSACTEEKFETITIRNVSIDIPVYWEEEGSKNGNLSYYAEKTDAILFADVTVGLDIEFKEDSDPDYSVTFQGLEADNENMIKAIEEKYNDANILSNEVYESKYGVKGILYKFSFNKSTGLFSEEAAKGYCFCFASESDRRWYYVTMVKINDADEHSYEEDYMKTIASIKCDNVGAIETTASNKELDLETIPTEPVGTIPEETTPPTTSATVDRVGAPDDWTNLLEKHYEEVKKQFEDAGFTNITCVAHEIDYNENYVFEGSVVNIAIGENGEICTFEKSEQWPKNIKIQIDYRVKPNGEKNADIEVTSPEYPTDSNPYNKVEDYRVYTKSEYAHIDSDLIRLGNGERVWITIEANPSTLTTNDFIVDYDNTMLEVIDVTSSTSGNTLEIEFVVKAKQSGVSEIVIYSGYELYEDAENAKYYVLTVNGLNSKDGRVVYVTSTGEKYHYSATCVSSGTKTTLSDALAYEYEPCGKCVK